MLIEEVKTSKIHVALLEEESSNREFMLKNEMQQLK